MKLLLASNNGGKLREFRSVLESAGFRIYSLADAGVAVEVVEDGATFSENALKKARTVAAEAAAGGEFDAVIADDSGICADALGGAPGVFSARYSERGDDANNEKILREMRDKADRRAHFVCALAICFRDGREEVIEERWDGEIANQSMGSGGFGYDRVFVPEGFEVTSAQLSPEVKNKISHRAKCLQQLIFRLRE
ncbi:MAG: RdgB/HAM1 family non-canonical purine NTP pyrophosphatase [Clostridiales bacterium]|nr:RdgB/HAM1 family non-canonical purine NTP pyrophosphatase [Clostridiales bacterium]